MRIIIGILFRKNNLKNYTAERILIINCIITPEYNKARRCFKTKANREGTITVLLEVYAMTEAILGQIKTMITVGHYEISTDA